LAIYKIVVFIVERASQIADFISSVVDSVADIVSGAIGAAANRIEKALIQALALIIDLLARIIGLSGIAQTIKSLIKKVQDKVEKAIDFVIAKVVQTVKKLFGKVTGKEKNKSEDPEVQKRWTEGMKAVRELVTHSQKDPYNDKEIKTSLDKIKTKFKFKTLSPTLSGREWRVHALMNPEDDVIVKAEAKRPPELEGKSTPNLDKLEKEHEEGAALRYVEGYKNYKGTKYKDIVTYVEHRAARKLGRIKEKPGLAAYAAAGGATSSKNTKTIEILRRSPKGTGYTVQRQRIPDFFSEGTIVGDVKDVKTQSLDEQMRDNIRITKADRVRVRGQADIITAKCRFDLVVRAPKDSTQEGTHVSDNLKAAIAASGGQIYEVL
ncbi:MAG: putative toxin, partial [Pyrinomonadaceae bacterium]